MKRGLLIVASLLFLGWFVNAQDYSGTIIRVIDGDTFVLQTEDGSLKIRMYGIDAPEKDQAFGSESKKFLNGYLNKRVIVKKINLDKYGRTLGVLFINGENINKKCVLEGYAWQYKYSKDNELKMDEENAMKNKKGLWKDGNAVNPWVWRKTK